MVTLLCRIVQRGLEAMGMRFEELDNVTRRYMLDEFETEQAGGNPYVPKNLSAVGRQAFPDLMRSAIRSGNDDSLIEALRDPALWEVMEPYEKNGVVRQRRINIGHAAERLGLTEFNTWYVRGLARRLMDEGVEFCQVYRAAPPKGEPAECAQHEGRIYPVRDIYQGHRRRYWPEPGNPAILSIPAGPSCHHTIRRV